MVVTIYSKVCMCVGGNALCSLFTGDCHSQACKKLPGLENGFLVQVRALHTFK